jgi:mono/diheme cytochrome c family protein
MGKFIAGVIVTVVCIAVGAYIYTHFGFINLAADAPVPKIELFYVHGMVDAWARRNAPKSAIPVPTDDANMIEGVKLYKMNCSVCHGSPENPIASVGRGLYPKAPQFMKHAPDDMTEPMIFQITKHGISRTGMLSWGEILRDDQIWQIAAFLKNFNKMSPAVNAVWQSAPEPSPLPGSPQAGAEKQPPSRPNPDIQKQGQPPQEQH